MDADRRIRIRDRDRAAYERDGVVCLRGVFAPAWLEFLAGAVAIPTEDPGLGHGARLDCDRFPLAWRSAWPVQE